ncbi:uncharacterized protein KZ484_019496 isoform 1-T1 [Pholidichthys leucotaenia]
MELVSLEQEAQMSRDGENSSMAPVRKTKPGSSSQDGSIKTTAATGVKLFWLLPVTIGIICVLQAVLNVSLRLTLLSHQKSLTEDRDRLKTIISEIEAKNRNLTQQRDELMRKTCNSHQKSLTEDRDQLKTIISEIEAKNRNLTQQRDELRKTCNSPQKALTEDRDQLKTIISDFIFQQGWTCFKQSLYYISSSSKSWQESREYCQQNGSDLVIITTKEEQDFLVQFNKRSWIGLTDKEKEGTWKWVDGTLLDERFHPWDEGEPNNDQGSEHCGELLHSKGSWNDNTCTEENYWICETALVP